MGLAGCVLRQEAETSNSAVDPADGLSAKQIATDHDRAVGVHPSRGYEAETSHGAVDPAEGLLPPPGGNGITDHDRAVGVHAIGKAFIKSRQKAKALEPFARSCGCGGFGGRERSAPTKHTVFGGGAPPAPPS